MRVAPFARFALLAAVLAACGPSDQNTGGVPIGVPQQQANAPAAVAAQAVAPAPTVPVVAPPVAPTPAAPTPVPEPTAVPTPVPPPHPLSIAAMRARDYPGSDLTIEQ